MNSYPRETVEFVPVTVTHAGTAITTNVSFAVLATTDRPTAGDWSAAVTSGSDIGVIISGLTAGIWHIWAKITASPETIVIDCGPINVT